MPRGALLLSLAHRRRPGSPLLRRRAGRRGRGSRGPPGPSYESLEYATGGRTASRGGGLGPRGAPRFASAAPSGGSGGSGRGARSLVGEGGAAAVRGGRGRRALDRGPRSRTGGRRLPGTGARPAPGPPVGRARRRSVGARLSYVAPPGGRHDRARGAAARCCLRRCRKPFGGTGVHRQGAAGEQSPRPLDRGRRRRTAQALRRRTAPSDRPDGYRLRGSGGGRSGPATGGVRRALDGRGSGGRRGRCRGRRGHWGCDRSRPHRHRGGSVRRCRSVSRNSGSGAPDAPRIRPRPGGLVATEQRRVAAEPGGGRQRGKRRADPAPRTGPCAAGGVGPRCPLHRR